MQKEKTRWITIFLTLIALPSLQAQTYLTVNAMSGTQTVHTLSGIRKQTFSNTGNMVVMSTAGNTDTYVLSEVRNLTFSDVSTKKAITTSPKYNLQLYPNPVQKMLNIQIFRECSQTATVELLSIEGRVLYQVRLNGKTSYQVNLSHFRQGIYLCRLNNGITIETTKFLKQ